MTLPLLTSAKLTTAGFSHAFTTRLGGVSPAPFESLDFAVRRDPAILQENQARLAAAVGFGPGALHQSMQVHGADLVVAGDDPTATLALEADALAAEPGTDRVVAVRVADCAPVLLADPASGRVVAAHAGWRGVEAGVVARSVRHLAESPGAGHVHGFVAAIGPCIGPCCFEVGADVGERIARASAPEVIVRRGGDKAYVDLCLAVHVQLRRHGLADAHVDIVPPRGRCTRCDPANFYSYRRDGDASGRTMGVIVAR